MRRVCSTIFLTATAMAPAMGIAACGSVTDDPAASADADPRAPDGGRRVADANPFAPDAAPGSADAARGGPDAAPEPPAAPFCRYECATAADCDFGSAINDSDNNVCDRGVCVYTGCNSTSECASALGANYACGRISGIDTRYCLQVCARPSDCATTSPAYDADNYSCTNGVCEYIGCNSNAECTTAFGSGYGCHAFEGWSYPTCLLRCSSAAGCAISMGGSLYDADNYACDDGYCRWTGCNSSTECADSLRDSHYVCR